MELINRNIDDILDIEGKGLNFINNQPFSDSYRDLAAKWGKLPMYRDKKSIKSNQEKKEKLDAKNTNKLDKNLS